MLLFLVACSMGPPPLTGVPRIEVSLPVKWVAGTDPIGTTSFSVEQSTAGRLFLDGIWYGAEITLDGQVLGVTRLGHAPMVYELPTLSAGTHQLSLRLIRPDESEHKAQTLANRNWRQRAGVVELWLGAASITGLGLPMQSGQIQPTLTFNQNIPEGSTVEVVISRDGVVETSWDAVPVGAEFPAQTWRGALWEIGKPELWTGTAILRSKSGEVLDVFSQRYGIWEIGMQEDVLTLNGHKTPLMSLRVNPLESAARLVAALPESGGNAVEVHGEVPDGRWLSYFDEWGVPVVYMPRCDGNLWQMPRMDMDIRAVWERIAPVTREQDARLLSASLARPAVLAWICEGSSSMRDVACGNLKTDPLHRPIMGIDNFALSIAGVENTHFEKRAWIIEIGATEHFQSFQKAGEAFMGATGPSGPGGVYFPPPPVDQDKWGPAWQGVSKALGITPWFSENRRGMSVVLVKGLAPGELVYLDMPWQVGTGAVADSWGNARIEAWYVGETELMIGGEKRKVTLTPDSWEGTTRKERAITVTK